MVNESPETIGDARIQTLHTRISGLNEGVSMEFQFHVEWFVIEHYGSEGAAITMMAGDEVQHEISERLIAGKQRGHVFDETDRQQLVSATLRIARRFTRAFVRSAALWNVIGFREKNIPRQEVAV